MLKLEQRKLQLAAGGFAIAAWESESACTINGVWHEQNYSFSLGDNGL